MSLDELLLQALNGLSFGALLFVLASGFTLVFGLMQIVNLAHGAFYLVGGYVGIALVVADTCLAVFGGNPRSVQVPSALSGSVQLGAITYPTYRLFVLALAVVLGVALYVIQHRTRLGALIRAGVDDREIAESLGINVPRVFTAMFVFGAALAGLAGVVAAGLLTLRPGADTDILLFALVVVVVGGLGSLQGAAVGSALIGLVDALSKAWVPELSSFAVFAPMAIVLMFRPAGLFRRART